MPPQDFPAEMADSKMEDPCSVKVEEETGELWLFCPQERGGHKRWRRASEIRRDYARLLKEELNLDPIRAGIYMRLQYKNCFTWEQLHWRRKWSRRR